MLDVASKATSKRPVGGWPWNRSESVRNATAIMAAEPPPKLATMSS